jgi:hypothetical protein
MKLAFLDDTLYLDLLNAKFEQNFLFFQMMMYKGMSTSKEMIKNPIGGNYPKLSLTYFISLMK